MRGQKPLHGKTNKKQAAQSVPFTQFEVKKKKSKQKPLENKPATVTHVCYPNTWEAEVGGQL